MDLVVVSRVFVNFCDLNSRVLNVHNGAAFVVTTRRANPMRQLDRPALLTDRECSLGQEVMRGPSAFAGTGMFFLWKRGHVSVSPEDRFEMEVSSHQFRYARYARCEIGVLRPCYKFLLGFQVQQPCETGIDNPCVALAWLCISVCAAFRTDPGAVLPAERHHRCLRYESLPDRLR